MEEGHEADEAYVQPLGVICGEFRCCRSFSSHEETEQHEKSETSMFGPDCTLKGAVPYVHVVLNAQGRNLLRGNSRWQV